MFSYFRNYEIEEVARQSLNSGLKKNSGRCFRLWIGGPQKKIVKIAGPDPDAPGA
jgi:hypothetical protein